MSDNKNILLETGTNEVEIAEFGIYLKGEERCQSFGINVVKVREIIRTPEFKVLPNTPNNVVGVFTLRDKIIPIINLAGWLNYKDDMDLKNTFVIVTEFNQDNFGFLVHKIEQIYRMSWEKVLPPISFNTGIDEDCVTGVVLLGENDEKIMFMLDFEKIVADINPSSSMDLELDVMKIKSDDFTDKTVLLAEDSGMIRSMLRDILEKGGFNVVDVGNGKIAWNLIQKWGDEATKKNIPINDLLTLVITDIEMPQMDGHSLLRNIKENPQYKPLPVILFSSLIYEEMRKKGEYIGADAQISKPEFKNLLNVVSEVLNKKHKS